MQTLLFHNIERPAPAYACCINLFKVDGGADVETYMVHTSVNGSAENIAQMYNNSRDAAAAFLDAITKAEKDDQ